MVRPHVRLLLTLLMAALLPSASRLLAQGSGSSRLSPPRQTRPQTPAEFQQSFWKHITQKSPYRNWERWPAGSEDARPADGPHGPWVKTYAKQAGSNDSARLGYGSILVQEDYGNDKTTLKAVSVMYCVKGADPAHYDWYWLKYAPDGTVMRLPADQGGKPIAGKVQSCIQCHQKAKADLVFSNDEDPRDDKTDFSEKD